MVLYDLARGFLSFDKKPVTARAVLQRERELL